MVCQRCHAGVTSAPRQDNRLKAEVSVIADVVVKKYVEHQPLYRQQQGFDRLLIPLSRQTLCDWTGWCSDQVEPIVQAMAKHICAQPLIQSDETPVRMQLANGQMETARLWAYGLPWAEVVFDFRTDKSQQGPKEFLQGTTARFLQTDGAARMCRSLRLWNCCMWRAWRIFVAASSRRARTRPWPWICCWPPSRNSIGSRPGPRRRG